jgi:hypothetical protein
MADQPRDRMDVIQSPSAEALWAYCCTLAQEFGLTLESVRWGIALHPEHVHDCYNLTLRGWHKDSRKNGHSLHKRCNGAVFWL